MASQQVRETIIRLLGAQCADCGLDDTAVLHVDHVNDDGALERSMFKTAKGNLRRAAYMRHVLTRIQAGSKRYALRCANCNWRKEMERRTYG